MEVCRDMAAEMLKTANRNLSGGLDRDRRTDRPGPALPGLGAELGRMIMNSKSNAKWNRGKAGYSLEVDLAGVTVSENRQFGTPVYSVGGTISVMLTDSASGDTVGADVEIDRFTEMSDDLICDAIKKQMQPKVNDIIRELLSGLD
jgi:hypothetical protein